MLLLQLNINLKLIRFWMSFHLGGCFPSCGQQTKTFSAMRASISAWWQDSAHLQTGRTHRSGVGGVRGVGTTLAKRRERMGTQDKEEGGGKKRDKDNEMQLWAFGSFLPSFFFPSRSLLGIASTASGLQRRCPPSLSRRTSVSTIRAQAGGAASEQKAHYNNTHSPHVLCMSSQHSR